MKKFLNEFKDFALRGNVLDLSVAVIIGAAFQAIINSVVNDLINPVLSIFIGGINFADRYIPLKPADHIIATAEQLTADGTFSTKDLTVADATLEQLKTYGVGVFNYGSFITAVINFIIMAFVIFLLVKAINKLSSFTKKDEVVAPTTKKCPFCCTEISIKATRCPHCTSVIPEEEEKEKEETKAE